MTQETIGQAKIVRRNTATFPSRKANYYDLTPWGGGYIRLDRLPPGAGKIKDDILVDFATGRVYRDSRFAKES